MTRCAHLLTGKLLSSCPSLCLPLLSYRHRKLCCPVQQPGQPLAVVLSWLCLLHHGWAVCFKRKCSNSCMPACPLLSAVAALGDLLHSCYYFLLLTAALHADCLPLPAWHTRCRHSMMQPALRPQLFPKRWQMCELGGSILISRHKHGWSGHGYG